MAVFNKLWAETQKKSQKRIYVYNQFQYISNFDILLMKQIINLFAIMLLSGRIKSLQDN